MCVVVVNEERKETTGRERSEIRTSRGRRTVFKTEVKKRRRLGRSRESHGYCQLALFIATPYAGGVIHFDGSASLPTRRSAILTAFVQPLRAYTRPPQTPLLHGHWALRASTDLSRRQSLSSRNWCHAHKVWARAPASQCLFREKELNQQRTGAKKRAILLQRTNN